MDAPFRDASAELVQIERLEEHIGALRAELAATEAEIPENGDAYLRRVVEENAELRRDNAYLRKALAELRHAH
jgi:regulator of replication initiation timing